ncbi:AAA family ATPase [Thermodesulfobacteriota bacterium]
MDDDLTGAGWIENRMIMYQEYFGFNGPPFSIAPDPSYLYMSERHREALAHLLYGIKSEGGFVLITGEVGTGKTTVCRCFFEQLPEHTDVAFVLNPKVTVSELLATICDEFHIPYPPGNDSIKVFVDLLNRFLLKEHAKGNHAVLILDEAQNLSAPVLEQLRLLTNLETNERKLLQIILIGQPELKDMLARPELRQLGQRITARYHLEPLSEEEVGAYVAHRLGVAGVVRSLFSSLVIRKLYRYSGGVPRLINVICDRALLGAFVQGHDKVDTKTLSTAAREVLGDMEETTPLLRRYGWALAGAAVFAGLVLAVSYYQDTTMSDPVTTAATLTENTIPEAGPQENSPGSTTVVDKIPPEQPVPLADPAEETSTGLALAAPVKNPAPGQSVEEIPAESTQEERPTLEWSQEISPDTSWNLAFQALFKKWGVLYDPFSGVEPCQYAPSQSLNCLALRGSLSSMLHFNRPAILTLYNQQGEKYYAAMTAYNDSMATFFIGNETREVSLEEISARWLGEYTLLWSSPLGFHSILNPGGKGRIVEWLDQKFAVLEGRDHTAGNNLIYDQAMVRKVKQYQLAKSLIPDGIVGPQTIIHLNSETASSMPLLTSGKKGE